MAAPGALIGYALLGTSRSLIVSATTATSALSAAVVGPLADGDARRFLALSAALGLLAGIVLIAGGVLGLGAIADFVAKPVMAGFLFGLGLGLIVSQAPALLGVAGGGDDFFPRVADLLEELGSIHWLTAAVGLASVAALVVLKRLAPRLPATLLLLAVAIGVSAAFGLSSEGVEVIELPEALPDPAFPDVSGSDFATLLPAAIGVLILSTEAVGVSRALAAADHYEVDTSRDLVAMGAGNVLSGLSSGFVQSGGASQTAAANTAGGRTQLTAVVAAVLILLTGAFLAPLFTDLPQAALAAIVMVAVAGFVDVPELRRLAGLRRSAIALAVTALAGVLIAGVLEGLIFTALVSLGYVLKRLSRPGVVARPSGEPGVVVVRPHAPLFYANAHAVRENLLALAREAGAHTVILDLEHSFDLDVETLDMLVDLRRETDCGSSVLARRRSRCCVVPASTANRSVRMRHARLWVRKTVTRGSAP